MSINDQKGKAIVTLGAIYEWVFKAAMWVILVGIPSFGLFLFNTRDTVRENRWRIERLESATSRAGITQSVNVGKVDDVAADSGREYLNVQEVAEREAVTDRTIINWIEEGRIFPPPRKPGKEWVISEGYRILPNLAARIEGEGPVMNRP